jgi:ribonuclease-3
MSHSNNRVFSERDVQALLSRYGVSVSVLDVDQYQRAMRHGTLGERTNERLEFLGDAVVALVVSEYCHVRYPDQDEGFLTRLRMQIVSGGSLARLSIAAGLPAWLVLPANQEGLRSRPSVQEDAMEAFVGAIHVTHGYAAAHQWFVTVLEEHANLVDFIARLRCSKDRLIKHYTAKFGVAPDVQTHEHEDGSHLFTTRVFGGDVLLAEATAVTRREAEIDACLRAWQSLWE